MKDFQHEEPENWKWGVFYFNKKDFRLIVPKRNPIMGWTFNFAHPNRLYSFDLNTFNDCLSIHN